MPGAVLGGRNQQGTKQSKSLPCGVDTREREIEDKQPIKTNRRGCRVAISALSSVSQIVRGEEPLFI